MNASPILKLLPQTPGVYRFLDKDGVVIYVGKAVNLKRRVSQYFQSQGKHNVKTSVMVSHIESIEHTVVETEAEALLLENNLIKQYQPKYNILLKDDKTYPWICIKNEPFPRVFITRHYKKDGSLYFGPYSSVLHAHNLLDLIHNLYLLRTCNLSLSIESITLRKHKECLKSHIFRCSAPCVGKISKEKYDEQIEEIKQILKGNSSFLIRQFEDKMKEAAAELRFEEAQHFKENMLLLKNHYSKSLVSGSDALNADVFTIVPEEEDAYGSFFRIHNGAIIQSVNLRMKVRIEEEQSSILSTFITEIYSKYGESGSRLIIVPFLPDIAMENVKYQVPQKGVKNNLLELSRKNALMLKEETIQKEDKVLEAMKHDLNMTELPTHIECFDNSNLQGTNPVASCVVFKNGKPDKKSYRHFNIKTVVGANDYASMKEVVNRRYSRLLEEKEELPQLVVIDGGKGQVSFAYEAICELGLEKKIKLIGLAKRMEEIIVPGDSYPYFLDRNSSSLRILMQIRDEAHRFGITHHRNKRSKAQIHSELDSIKGIGAKTREILIKKYKSVARIKKAPYDEIEDLIGKKRAEILLREL